MYKNLHIPISYISYDKNNARIILNSAMILIKNNKLLYTQQEYCESGYQHGCYGIKCHECLFCVGETSEIFFEWLSLRENKLKRILKEY